MYRTFFFAGVCALAVVVTLGQLERYSRADKPAGGPRQDRLPSRQHARQDLPDAERPARQDLLSAGRQRQPRRCYHCAIAPADLSLSDATYDGVTITNRSNSTLEEVTFEVTMKDCPPGFDPATASPADRCVTAGQQSRGAELFIPPGQARGFHVPMSLRQVPLAAQSRRFFLWRIVSASGTGAP